MPKTFHKGGQRRTIVCGCGFSIRADVRTANAKMNLHKKLCPNKTDESKEINTPFNSVIGSLNGWNGVGRSHKTFESKEINTPFNSVICSLNGKVGTFAFDTKKETYKSHSSKSGLLDCKDKEVGQEEEKKEKKETKKEERAGGGKKRGREEEKKLRCDNTECNDKEEEEEVRQEEEEKVGQEGKKKSKN